MKSMIEHLENIKEFEVPYVLDVQNPEVIDFVTKDNECEEVIQDPKTKIIIKKIRAKKI